MPNHVKNIVTLEGDTEKIQQILEKIKNDEYGIGTVDFEKILPMPSFVPESQVIDWRRFSWGTKWNAYDYQPDIDYGEKYGQSGVLEFLTAWSAPHPVMEKLSQMFPEIEFTHEWADEDLGMNCGRRSYSGGERIEKYSPEYGIESQNFACSLWYGDSEENEEENITQSAV